MLTLSFLVNTLFSLLIKLLLLRIWMKWARCDFYNPFTQFVVKLTQPLVKPLQRILPSRGLLDLASLLLAFLLATIQYPLTSLIQSHAVLFDPVYLLVGVLSLLKAAGYLIFWVLIIRALLSWVSQGRNPIEYVLIQLSEPLMAPIRNRLPATGGIDFSAMIVMLILYVLNFVAMDLFPSLWGQLL